MEPTIFRFILRHSPGQQVLILVVTLVSFPFLYASLELPKRIINEAIGGGGFPRPLLGTEVGQVEYLLILCGLFLALVLVNGAFKFWINVYKGRLGERMLRRLRYMLFSRTLRFPLPHFRKISQGEIIAMVTAEVEPLGGFIGDALALPAFQGGTLLTIVAFMFVQDPILGVAAVALYPLQIILIPRLQKRVNQLAKQRIQEVRRLSEHIGETVSGMQEIHAHDTSELELAKFSRRLGGIFSIRLDIYRRKFVIKFLNNFLANLTPLFFYSIGGYLVIMGELTFGALVAVLAAHKDLSAPWKELLRFYQQKEDARIKYRQLIEQFQPPGMLDEDLQRKEPDAVTPLRDAVVVTNLSLEEEGGIKVVDGTSFRFDPAETTAVIGGSGASRTGLAQLLGRLLAPSEGSIRIGEANMAHLAEGITGRRMAYIDQNVHLFSGGLRDNLVYGLKHRPPRAAGHDDEGRRRHERFVKEARASGCTTSDAEADWIDYDGAGVSGPGELGTRILDVLRTVDLEHDVFELGLQGTIDPAADSGLAARILEARAALHQRMQDPALAALVEPFDRERYNCNMSVAENLLFGTPIGPRFRLDRLGENPHVQAVLGKVGLDREFLDIGLKLAEIMVELFQDLPPDHEYFERFGFIGADDLPMAEGCCRRVLSEGVESLDQWERDRFTSLPFKLVPARHRLGLIDEDTQRRLLEARRLLAAGLPADERDAVAFFDRDAYNAATSIQDNILFGKLVYGRPHGAQTLRRAIADVVDSLDLRRPLLEVGLDSPIGIGGGRLTVVQKQKLGIARCLLKRPDIMVINDATATFDPAGQKAIMDGLFEEFGGRGLLWVLNRADQARYFARSLVVENGKVVEQGPFDDLNQPGKLLHRMVAAEWKGR